VIQAHALALLPRSTSKLGQSQNQKAFWASRMRESLDRYVFKA
jgi:hypothetical protein